MKWNWGTNIALTFVAFAMFMGYLVVSSFQQNIDLVTEDYYGEELKYEQRISHTKNANALKGEVEIKLDGENYLVTIPQENIESGEIYFYRPNDKRLDKTYAIKSNLHSVKVSDLIPGMFRAKVSWITNGVKYYSEQVIIVK